MMNSDLEERPEHNLQSARELLSEAARRRLDHVHEAGLKKLTEAAVAFNRSDDDQELYLSQRAACFDCAFRTMASLVDELQALGIFGERLKSIMSGEIEGITNSLAIVDSRGALQELLFTEWGW